MEKYVFTGENAKDFMESKKHRAVADALRKRLSGGRLPRNEIEGMGQVFDAIMLRSRDKKADAAQQNLIDNLGADHKAVQKLMGIPAYQRGTNYHPGGDAIVGEDGPEIVNLPKGAKVKTAGETRQAIAQALRPRSQFDDEKAYQTADLDAFKMMQLQPEYGDAVEADVNATEGQRINYLRRMMFANAALEDPRLGEAMTRMDNSIAGGLGAIGRLYTDDNYELGRLMAEQFAMANLRNESGAAIPPQEVKGAMRQYFPQPNETPEQLQAKASLRREVIRSIEQALGGDASPVVQQIRQEIGALREQADVPDGSLTGGPEKAEPDADGWRVINGVRVRVKQ